MKQRCKLDSKSGNVVTVTNNNVKYYEDLAKQHSVESKNSAIKSEIYANKAITYTNSHIEDKNNPHNVTVDQIGTYSAAVIEEKLLNGLAQKNPNLVAGQNIVIAGNDDGTQTISSFNTIEQDYLIAMNKPSINSVLLVGNKSSHELGLAAITDLPTNVSELQNDKGYLTAHQDITGKQDVLNSGDGISIENNTVSTINRLDTNLSNITDAGKKVFDGKWEFSYYELHTATSKGDYTLDLSEYLPDDNYDYEVEFLFYVRQSSSASEMTKIYVYNPTNLSEKVALVRAHAAREDSSSIRLPIRVDDRSLKINIEEKADTVNVSALSYRRLGTNS